MKEMDLSQEVDLTTEKLDAINLSVCHIDLEITFN